MKQFNWRKMVFMSAGLAFTANTWAAENFSEAMKLQSLPDNYVVLAAAETDLPTGKQEGIIDNPEQSAGSKADFEKLKAANLAQLASLHQKMRRVLSHNYYDFLEIAGLVEKALNAFNVAKEAEIQAQAAAESGEWQNAMSAASTWQKALDKAASIETQAKAALEEQGAKRVIGAVVSETPAEEMVADGAMLYSSKGCIACHGPAGKMPLKPNYPKLAGQDLAYAAAQMKDIKSSARANGESVAMKGMMHLVSDQEMEVIADWLASLEMDITSEVSMDSEGAMLYSQKSCVACHGADAKTPLPNYPKIAGQNQVYVFAQMADIKSGVRDNGQTGAMKGIMGMVNEEEMEAIAQWLASFSEPAKEVTITTEPLSVEEEAMVTAEPDLKSEPVVSETHGEAMAEVAEGAMLYTNKGCITCHGKDGQVPIIPNYPKLAGQNLDYSVAQMADIKSGARNNGMSVVMKGLMHTVSDDEMSTIAGWLASLPRKSGMASDATLAAQGAELYQSKICHTCHGPDAQTPITPAYPKLSGQNPAYTVAQMADIKSGVRDNGQTGAMKGIMGMVNEEEMKAIAQWLVSP